jgi:hypothetical protein
MSNFSTGRIEDIISFWQSKGGFQRANRYRVEIQRGVGAGGRALPSTGPALSLEAVAISVQTPSRTLEFVQDNNAGPSNPPIKIPVKTFFDDRFIVTFVVDSKWEVRRFFDQWMNDIFPNNVMNQQNASSTVSPYVQNLGNITLTPLTVNHRPAAKIYILEAYPKQIIPGEMAQNMMDTPFTLIVDFNYRYYKIDPASGT